MAANRRSSSVRITGVALQSASGLVAGRSLRYGKVQPQMRRIHHRNLGIRLLGARRITHGALHHDGRIAPHIALVMDSLPLHLSIEHIEIGPFC